MPVRGRSARRGGTAGPAPVVRIASQRSGLIVDTCRATRLLAPALVVAITVSSLGGSDLVAWIAAAATVAVLLGVQRVRGAAPACAVGPRRATPQHDERTVARPAEGASDASPVDEVSATPDTAGRGPERRRPVSR